MRVGKVLGLLAGVSVLAGALFVPAASVAGSQPVPPQPIGFDEPQAVASNGVIPDADPVRVCGAADKRFLGELLGGDALNFKIPYRLGDVVAGNVKPTATGGKQMMLAGTVESDVFGTGDFPFDHPGGSDFNMDVGLDPAYAALSQSAGVEVASPMHTELSEYMVPHLPTAAVGPATGMTWEDNSTLARTDIQPGYFPTKGDRVIVMGRYVNDCGHIPFSTELHAISFLAWSHTEATKTVAQTYYAPFREMETYNPDRALANKVNQANRKNMFYSVSFPQGLITSILRVQNLGGLPPIDHLESWGMIEAVNAPPADWWVCAPTGTSGDTLDINYDFVARPGVVITATPDLASGCARMHTSPGTNVTPEPTLRTCVLPWTWLSQVAADEAGVPSLDLKATLKSYVGTAYKSRIDPDPIMDCYNPQRGPVVSPTPVGQNVTVDATISQPFYGRVEVSWSTAIPVTTTSTSTSTTSSSSTTSTPTGQTLTITPPTAAQGGAFDVSSAGWLPDTPVTFTLDDGTVLGTVTTDRFGVAAASFTVPSATTVGAHQMTASGTAAVGAMSVTGSLTVTAAVVFASTNPPLTTTTGTLPTTGAAIAKAVALGSFLVLFGLAMVALTRRRRVASI